jgi:hypothetical protein
MPWGCIGSGLLGESGPGIGDCTLLGTFTTNLGFVPSPILSAFNSDPKKPEAPK